MLAIFPSYQCYHLILNKLNTIHRYHLWIATAYRANNRDENMYRGAHAVFLAVRGLDKINILHRDRDREPRHGKNITALRGMV